MDTELFNINDVNEEFYNDVVRILGKYDVTICESIVTFVSALFHIDKDEIFLHNKKSCYTIPRWLCWCAFSQFTNQSFDTIAENFSKGDKKYSGTAVCHGVSNVRNIIDNDPVVRSKWQMIKKFLKANENVPVEKKITIIVPVGLKHKIEIKEARI